MRRKFFGISIEAGHPSADWIQIILIVILVWWRPHVKQLGKYFVDLTSLLIYLTFGVLIILTKNKTKTKNEAKQTNKTKDKT